METKWKFVNNLNPLVADPLYLACYGKKFDLEGIIEKISYELRAYTSR